MCRGLFIELNADIKKPTAMGWFSWDFWSAREDLNLRPPDTPMTVRYQAALRADSWLLILPFSTPIASKIFC